jgi:large subunit ribosomal protein L9
MAEIILKEHVRKLGKIGQVVKVANGYAFNFLIPHGKALPATPDNLLILEKHKSQMIIDDQKNKEIAQELLKKIPSEICIAKSVNQNGALYGAISAKDVAEQIKLITDKHSVRFSQNIQKYGVYSAEIDLHHDVVAKVLISVSDTIENAKNQILAVSTKKEIAKKTKEENVSE